MLKISKTSDIPKKQRVFISGIFNVLHPGHIRLFKYASELANKVIVGLQQKGDKDHNMFSDEERLQALNTVSLIDEVVLIEDLLKELRGIKPDLVLKGSEFKDRTNIEEALLAEWGGKLVFSSGENPFHSERFTHRNGYKNDINFPTAYRNYVKRHHIQRDSLAVAIDRVSTLKIAVIGDIILDEYVDCEPVGLSREDATVVVTPSDANVFVGGAAIVAQHTRALGAAVDFYSVAGADVNADWLETQMSTHGVNSFIYRDESRPTTVKRRFRTHHKTLLRVNEYRSHSLAKPIQQQLLSRFEQQVKHYDLVVFSDFSYGLLTSDLVNKLQAIASANGVSMVADSQTSSQRGDLRKFKDLLLVTPTEIEARLAVGIESDNVGLAVVIEQLAKALNAQYVVITLGADGALILDNSDATNPRLDSLPALNNNPVDVAGAGDLLLISTAILQQLGCDVWHACLLGMMNSAIHISQVGNRPIDVSRVRQYLQQL